MKIAIIGAGLLGRLMSLCLAQRHSVSLYERSSLDDEQSIGKLAAAMVAPCAESAIASCHTVEMGRSSLLLWPQLLEKLNLSVQLRRKGSIVVAHRQDKADLEHFLQRISTDGNVVRHLSANELVELEPELQNQFFAAFLAEEGHIDNLLLYQQTKRAIVAHEQIKLFENTHIEASVDGLLSETKLVDYDLVIDCRGTGAKNQLINSDSKLRGVRGEIIRVKACEVSLTRPVRMMHPRYPLYIVPKANNEYVIGATEIESEDSKPVTVRSAMELLSAAYSLHRGFAEAEIVNIQSGLRPALLNNEAEIAVRDKHIQINGLYRHGFMITPHVLHQAIHLIDEKCLFSEVVKTDNQLIKHYEN